MESTNAASHTPREQIGRCTRDWLDASREVDVHTVREHGQANTAWVCDAKWPVKKHNKQATYFPKVQKLDYFRILRGNAGRALHTEQTACSLYMVRADTHQITNHFSVTSRAAGKSPLSA